MNDEENDCNADAGIGHIKCRPGMKNRRRIRAEIEQQEIDDVAVKQSIGQITENPGEQQRA